MAPDWTGSPQHVVAGGVLAYAVIRVTARRLRRTLPLWGIVAIGLAVTMAAEALVELAEYPLLYGSTASATAYYDTVGDIAVTLIGALLGAAAAAFVTASSKR